MLFFLLLFESDLLDWHSYTIDFMREQRNFCYYFFVLYNNVPFNCRKWEKLSFLQKFFFSFRCKHFVVKKTLCTACVCVCVFEDRLEYWENLYYKLLSKPLFVHQDSKKVNFLFPQNIFSYKIVSRPHELAYTKRQ